MFCFPLLFVCLGKWTIVLKSDKKKGRGRERERERLRRLRYLLIISGVWNLRSKVSGGKKTTLTMLDKVTDLQSKKNKFKLTQTMMVFGILP